MCLESIKPYINSRCVVFAMAVIYSFLAFTIAVIGMAGGFQRVDGCFFTSLIGTIIGLWFKIPTPRASTEIKQDKKELQKTLLKQESISEVVI